MKCMVISQSIGYGNILVLVGILPVYIKGIYIERNVGIENP